jgi:hypothetical protein
MIVTDKCLLARTENDVTHKLGAEEDLTSNVHGTAKRAGLDGVGCILAAITKIKRVWS